MVPASSALVPEARHALSNGTSGTRLGDWRGFGVCPEAQSQSAKRINPVGVLGGTLFGCYWPEQHAPCRLVHWEVQWISRGDRTLPLSMEAAVLKAWCVVLTVSMLPPTVMAAEQAFGSPLGCALYELGGVKAVIAGLGDVPAKLWDDEPRGPILVAGDLVASIGGSCPLSADRSYMSCVGEGDMDATQKPVPTKVPISLTRQPNGTLLYRADDLKPRAEPALLCRSREPVRGIGASTLKQGRRRACEREKRERKSGASASAHAINNFSGSLLTSAPIADIEAGKQHEAQGVGIFGLQSAQTREAVGSLGKSLELEQRTAQRRQGIDGIGSERKRLVVARHRLVQAPELAERKASTAQDLDGVGPDRERLVVARQRFVPTSHFLEDAAAAVETLGNLELAQERFHRCIREIRIDRKRLVVARQRFVEALEPLERKAPIAEGLGKDGVDRKRSVVARQRLIRTTEFKERVATPEERLGASCLRANSRS